MRACEKRFKYRPEVTRWKRRKTPTPTEKREQQKKNKTNGTKTKAAVIAPVSSGQG